MKLAPTCLIAASLLGLVVWRFGLSWQALAASVFVFSLLVLAIIDLHTHLLPDAITQPLLWLGLLVNLNGTFAFLVDAVLGAIYGYGTLWIIAKIYFLWRRLDGMGYGDFKLAAAIGAWLGYKPLLSQTLVMAALASSCVAIGIIYRLVSRKKRNKNSSRNENYKKISFQELMQTPIAFGPFLAAAGILTFLLPVPLLQFTQII